MSFPSRIDISLSGHLQQIAEGLQQLLGSDCRVETHDGQLSRDELKSATNRAPVVMVAFIGLPGMQPRGRDQWQVAASLAASILVRDQPGRPRHLLALDLAARVLQTIGTSADWGRADWFRAAEPDSIVANNLYSGALDEVQGVSLWAVTWMQTCLIAL